MGRRLLVVLDLNGTILQRLDGTATLALLKSKNPLIKEEANVHGRPVVSRPNARSFLLDLLSFADVAVWTSATAKNAVPMVMLGFSGLLERTWWDSCPEDLRIPFKNFQQRSDFPQTFGEHQLAFLWTQQQCDTNGYEPGYENLKKYDRKPQFIKSLKKIWTAFPDKYTTNNTIIIDDSPAKIPKLCQRNLIQIPEFDLSNGSTLQDDTLQRLGEYIKKLADADPKDVRSFIRDHSFTIDAQTS